MKSNAVVVVLPDGSIANAGQNRPLQPRICLENSDGLGAPHHCSLGAAPCYRLFTLTRAILMLSSHSKATFTGASHYEKNYPVLGWPVAAPSKGGFKVQAGELGVVAGRTGVQVWDLPTVGRVAVLTCFDVNFYELWHQAYALGAKIVFWSVQLCVLTLLFVQV